MCFPVRARGVVESIFPRARNAYSYVVKLISILMLLDSARYAPVLYQPPIEEIDSGHSHSS
jgi:hypothetical protein